MFALSLISLLAATSAFAAPPTSLCSVPSSALPVPANQTAILKPTTPPTFVSIALGVQNYTCANTSTYTNVGAVAELFDISCLFNSSLFGSIQDPAFAWWNASPPALTASSLITTLSGIGNPDVLGQHYFVPNPIGTGLSAKWDFTSSGEFAGVADAFVVTTKVEGLAAPTGPQDIDWLNTKSIQGDLANQVFRVNTRGGQPPAHCTFGVDPPISVRYAANYYFYGTTAKPHA